MTTWFTADTHFGHTNVIRYCARPFDSVQAMDETLIENWNQVVRPKDTVYHLGDFTPGGQQKGAQYFTISTSSCSSWAVVSMFEINSLLDKSAVRSISTVLLGLPSKHKALPPSK